jgi:RNA recognition motif-containing protein
VVEHRNQDATVYVGNLDASCTEDLLTELFVQVGRVRSVYMPKDKLSGTHNGYGFVEFLDVMDADYAITILNMIKLFGRPIRVSKSALTDQPAGVKEIGAKLFVGNLDPNEVDEQILYDAFSAFGTLTRPCVIARDEATNQSKGYAFVSYDNFQSSDTAIEIMNNQFLGNRQIVVQVRKMFTSDALHAIFFLTHRYCCCFCGFLTGLISPPFSTSTVSTRSKKMRMVKRRTNATEQEPNACWQKHNKTARADNQVVPYSFNPTLALRVPLLECLLEGAYRCYHHLLLRHHK